MLAAVRLLAPIAASSNKHFLLIQCGLSPKFFLAVMLVSVPYHLMNQVLGIPVPPLRGDLLVSTLGIYNRVLLGPNHHGMGRPMPCVANRAPQVDQLATQFSPRLPARKLLEIVLDPASVMHAVPAS
mmetsp:Transcript_21561/g.35587  ORF Transcript_21561/g.35587 Transcript_21561/m.35587 type:complete len:127 (-) Transcript_21561:391-771(-)